MAVPRVGSRGSGEDRLGYLLQQLTDRVRRLENRNSVAVGKWRLRQDPTTGDLLVHNTESGVTATVAFK